MAKKKIKVEFRNGWLYVNGKVAKLYSPLREVQADNGLLGALGRVIYQSGDILIKFDDSHWHQTRTEIRMWKDIELQDRIYFGKVLGWAEDETWIAVEKEKILVTKDLSQENNELLWCLVDKYNIGDIYANIRNNRGIRKKDGTLIIYDWGLKRKKEKKKNDSQSL